MKNTRTLRFSPKWRSDQAILLRNHHGICCWLCSQTTLSIASFYWAPLNQWYHFDTGTSGGYHHRPNQSSVIFCFLHFERTRHLIVGEFTPGRSDLDWKNLILRGIARWAAYLAFSAPPLLTYPVRPQPMPYQYPVVELVVSLGYACLITPLYSVLDHQRSGHLPSLTPHKRVMPAAFRPDSHDLLFVFCET
jgi:hypothetical protein